MMSDRPKQSDFFPKDHATGPQQYVAVEWLRGQQAIVHIVNRPALVTGAGRAAIRRMSSFDERMLQSRFPANKPFNSRAMMRWFSVKPKWEWDHFIAYSHASVTETSGEPWVEPVTLCPRVEHATVGDFLKYIGWDSKRGKLADA